MATPLILGPAEVEKLNKLRELAAARPVNMQEVVEAMETPEGKRKHRDRMTEQTVFIPANFLVTFSIEEGHPVGTCRHMSMSVRKKGRIPSPPGLLMVASALGFVGTLSDCTVWEEKLEGHGSAINVVQPLNFSEVIGRA